VRVFISWSGDPSRQLAEAIHRWLPSVLQLVKPYFSSDMDKGARWGSEISEELSKSKFGIVVLTRNNLLSPWINFEAGAISRTVGQAKVCPILFGIEPTDVSQGAIRSFAGPPAVRTDHARGGPGYAGSREQKKKGS
jgi:hypothetical protein